MASRSEIEATLKAAYAARKAGDLAGTMKHFADDVVFKLNAGSVPALAEASVGKAAATATMRELIETWQFNSWELVSLVVDGDVAALHSKVSVTCIPTKKTAHLELVDHLTFRDGKIAKMYQSTDTAQILALATP